MTESAHEPQTVVHAAHVPGHDHVHDHDVFTPVEDNPLWKQDNVWLHSVGMDIGSAGTQVIFSKLLLRRIGEDLSSRYVVVRRDTLHRSPVELTPYHIDDGEGYIDASALGSIIDRAYAEARLSPDEVDTGVVILTGEALRRRNARGIASVLADRGGELVTATAGHNMEAMLAAYGSGAAQDSYRTARRLLNVDIGGGTTKLGIVEDGRVAATAALLIGGRLIAVEDGIITRLEPGGVEHARRSGASWILGDRVTPEQLRHVAEGMADLLVAALTVEAPAPAVLEHYLTEPLDGLRGIDGVIFSGGVAEYVYGREDRDFGDLGPHLGAAIAARLDAGALPFPLLPPGECIRATALGASEYSVQLSGNTGYISDPDALLPRRNLAVLRPDYALGEEVGTEVVAGAIERHLEAFDTDPARTDVALALRFNGLPSYERLHAFAAAIACALSPAIAAGRPLYLMLDQDIARSLGRLLREELAVSSELLVIDGLRLDDFDFIDLGRVRHPSNTVPVTIKSLLFEGGGAEMPSGQSLP